LRAAGAEQVGALLDTELAEAVHQVDERAFFVETPRQYPVYVERSEAGFSSWYEIFPRSQSPEPGQHGTFQDVIAKLPAIRRMGFDVLYFPPIHPIGMRNRKGKNNSLQAEPGDPGSPYAVGSEAGGHDAVHPELGTLDDFRQLVAAAKAHDLEIALDFAIQCSPDHPWLRDHPDWFNWRADGTLKYAENPPKRYEDIVNPDFYSKGATPARQAALWRALRDIVLFWVRQGVKIFRVDNPHTKPLPFWHWMLTEVRDRHPDTIFLSEAFTRPAMMYRLAKVGFSQSYTYFTWRNTRQELTDYMTELNETTARDFFRPNFFVNTPDINPRFLQGSGRPGFLIRAALAATMSGSWGVYNGFEQCVADAVPGKEEYLDSEKYQLRQWRLDTPGNIVEEITRLNRIRRSHPALQSHQGIRFHRVDNDSLIFYSRFNAEGDSVVLVMVNLDPHHRHSATFELPLWEWGLADDARVHLHDLFHDRRFHLDGKHHRVELSPDQPFVLWARVHGEGEVA
jgi:starch synthase (maltosyl-transferring)